MPIIIPPTGSAKITVPAAQLASGAVILLQPDGDYGPLPDIPSGLTGVTIMPSGPGPAPRLHYTANQTSTYRFVGLNLQGLKALGGGNEFIRWYSPLGGAGIAECDLSGFSVALVAEREHVTDPWGDSLLVQRNYVHDCAAHGFYAQCLNHIRNEYNIWARNGPQAGDIRRHNVYYHSENGNVEIIGDLTIDSAGMGFKLPSPKNRTTTCAGTLSIDNNLHRGYGDEGEPGVTDAQGSIVDTGNVGIGGRVVSNGNIGLCLAGGLARDGVGTCRFQISHNVFANLAANDVEAAIYLRGDFPPGSFCDANIANDYRSGPDTAGIRRAGSGIVACRNNILRGNITAFDDSGMQCAPSGTVTGPALAQRTLPAFLSTVGVTPGSNPKQQLIDWARGDQVRRIGQARSWLGALVPALSSPAPVN